MLVPPDATLSLEFQIGVSHSTETFGKCSILFKVKPVWALPADRKGENFNRRNTLSILRIKI